LDAFLAHWHPDATSSWFLALVWGILALSIVVTVGMWFFCGWARLLYIPSGLLFAIYGPWSWYFPTRASEAVQFLSYCLQGVVFASACCFPFSPLFYARKV